MSRMIVPGLTQVPAAPPAAAGALTFNDPGQLVYAAGQTVNTPLAPYVTGGNAMRAFHRINTPLLPEDVAIDVSTGALSGRAHSSGGATIRVSDTVADALEADWLMRSRGPGVKWYHAFLNDSEVDPYILPVVEDEFYDDFGVPLVRRITTDGLYGGACLELFSHAQRKHRHRWSRPMACMPGDPGWVTGGSPQVNWRGGTYWNGYTRGFYGDRSYHASFPNTFEGSDFYLQFRYKGINIYNPNHGFANTGGKLMMVDVVGGGNQELIITQPTAPAGGRRRFHCYTNFSTGWPANGELDADQGARALTTYTGMMAQPGGEYADTCRYPNYATCWEWPYDHEEQWVTILLHFIPGHASGVQGHPVMTDTANYRDTGVEVWAAKWGETRYKKIWEKFDYVWGYDSNTVGGIPGLNLVDASQYMNGDVGATDWARRYTEVVFSSQFIPCPQYYPPL